MAESGADGKIVFRIDEAGERLVDEWLASRRR